MENRWGKTSHAGPPGAPVGNIAPGSWTGPYAGDQVAMPCGGPCVPMGPTMAGPCLLPATCDLVI